MKHQSVVKDGEHNKCWTLDWEAVDVARLQAVIHLGNPNRAECLLMCC